MSDRSFKFFTDIYNTQNSGNQKDSKTGLIQSSKEVEYQINSYSKTDPYKITKTENKKVTYNIAQSILNENEYVNYKGHSKTNDFLPYDGTPDNNENIDLNEIIQWSQTNHPSMKMLYGMFAFLEDFGKYPANRLMVLRRYASGVPHDLFSHTSKPLYTMVSYYDTDNIPVNISFNEKWTTFSDTFLSVLEDMIGIKLEDSDTMVGKAINFAKTNPLAQDVLQKVASSMGIQTGPTNIYGDPNLIYEAAIRESDSEGLKSGLEADVKITFETKYVQRDIGNISGETAFLMIIAEAVHMGTSNSRFLITGDATKSISGFINSLKNGDISGMFDTIVESLSDILSKAADKLGALVDKTKEAFKEGGITQAANVIGGTILNEIKDLLKARYQRYRWKLIGAVGAMSGIPTAPWHIAIGNPKNPWFVCGNLVVKSASIEFGGELGYNDMPSEMTVKYTLENGRSLGANEITSLYNSGKGRIYDTIDKLQTVNIPEGDSIKLPGNEVSSNGIQNQENSSNQINNEVVNTNEINDLKSSNISTSQFSLNNIDSDNNIPSI